MKHLPTANLHEHAWGMALLVNMAQPPELISAYPTMKVSQVGGYQGLRVRTGLILVRPAGRYTGMVC